MNMMTIDRPLTGEPLLPPTTQRVINRRDAALRAIGAMIDPEADRNNPRLAGCAVAPHAGFVMAATSLPRPMLFRECERIADGTAYDTLLLRFDPDRGVSFDILFRDSERWLCRYLAWRRRDSDLWLIPSAGDAPYIRTTAWEIEREPAPPFVSALEREAGIIRAIDNPSFEGGI